MRSPVDIIVEAPWQYAVRGEPWRALLYIPDAPRPFGGCGVTAWHAISEAFDAYKTWERLQADAVVDVIAATRPTAVLSQRKGTCYVSAEEIDPLQRPTGAAEMPLFPGGDRRRGGRR